MKNHKIKIFEFYKEILDIELNKYEFKVLIMVLALKDNNKIYSGTLKDMCEFLGLGYSSRNKKNIKNALDNLVANKILEYNTQKIYIIKLILKYHNENIIQINQEWIETIKNYRAKTSNAAVDWGNLLKIFLYLIINNNKKITTEIIANKTNLSQSIVNKALAAIKDINKQGGFGCSFTVWYKYQRHSHFSFQKKSQSFYLYKYEDVNKEIVYIGQTISLAQRIQQHTQDKLQNFSGIIYYIKCGSKEEMDFLEKVLINYYKPKFNIIYKERDDLTTNLINLNLNWQFYTKISI